MVVEVEVVEGPGGSDDKGRWRKVQVVREDGESWKMWVMEVVRGVGGGEKMWKWREAELEMVEYMVEETLEFVLVVEWRWKMEAVVEQRVGRRK